jgi:hypothetical protein
MSSRFLVHPSIDFRRMNQEATESEIIIVPFKPVIPVRDTDSVSSKVDFRTGKTF